MLDLFSVCCVGDGSSEFLVTDSVVEDDVSLVGIEDCLHGSTRLSGDADERVNIASFSELDGVVAHGRASTVDDEGDRFGRGRPGGRQGEGVIEDQKRASSTESDRGSLYSPCQQRLLVRAICAEAGSGWPIRAVRDYAGVTPHSPERRHARLTFEPDILREMEGCKLFQDSILGVCAVRVQNAVETANSIPRTELRDALTDFGDNATDFVALVDLELGRLTLVHPADHAPVLGVRAGGDDLDEKLAGLGLREGRVDYGDREVWGLLSAAADVGVTKKDGRTELSDGFLHGST